jgi:hypothetical protein
MSSTKMINLCLITKITKEFEKKTNMRFDFFVCVRWVIVIIFYKLRHIRYNKKHIIKSVIKLF